MAGLLPSQGGLSVGGWSVRPSPYVFLADGSGKNIWTRTEYFDF